MLLQAFRPVPLAALQNIHAILRGLIAATTCGTN